VAAKGQARKGKIISELIETRKSILDAASSPPSAALDEVFLGVWSIKDLVAHLVGWDLANIEAVEAILAGRLPAFYAHHDHDWKTFNAGLVARHKSDDFGKLISSVEDSHRELVDLLTTLPAEEFTKDRGVRFKGYKVTIARLLEAEIDDERMHHAQVKDFLHASTQDAGLSS